MVSLRTAFDSARRPDIPGFKTSDAPARTGLSHDLRAFRILDNVRTQRPDVSWNCTILPSDGGIGPISGGAVSSTSASGHGARRALSATNVERTRRGRPDRTPTASCVTGLQTSGRRARGEPRFLAFSLCGFDFGRRHSSSPMSSAPSPIPNKRNPGGSARRAWRRQYAHPQWRHVEKLRDGLEALVAAVAMLPSCPPASSGECW
ncbi:hypothetical protein VTO73DRAFT_10494 [Trametes versicolor]